MRRYALCLVLFLPIGAIQAADKAATNTPSAIPWNEIGAKAGADYKGKGLAVTPIARGAQLHCVFQRLDGEATPEGLWLTSTVNSTPSARFRVMALEVGRKAAKATINSPASESSVRLAGTGNVTMCGQKVRFNRPGLLEEYTVSADGVRQDFVVEQAPPNALMGELAVKLAVTGAQVESAADGARLVLDRSGRKVAYSRLRVTDATGKDLSARIEVSADAKLAVVVNDAMAIYPVRIDPTFTSANWTAMGSGMNGLVDALAVSGGTLYAGGSFTNAGGSYAYCIAQWNGNSWSALGSAMMNGPVYALAVSGGTLYAGGDFTYIGGSNINNIAQWDGSSWSALGAGMNNSVKTLLVSASTLYAGGYFTTAGGTNANFIAQWDGSNWSALGFGVGGEGSGWSVDALAVSHSTLYAGGYFTTAGGSNANYIAQWNGNSWSALGSGMNDSVGALAVSGSTLYAGGYFTTAGGSNAYCIAQWDGSSWSGLGSGMGSGVYALAVSGSTLYAGGAFGAAGGNQVSYFAQWDGSSWSPLASGMNNGVNALLVSGSTMYAGGYFTTAGTNVCDYIAEANLRTNFAIVTANSALGFTNGVFGFDVSGPSGSNVIIQASTNLSNWAALQTNQLGNNGLLFFSDPQSGSNSPRFYRVVVP